MNSAHLLHRFGSRSPRPLTGSAGRRVFQRVACCALLLAVLCPLPGVAAADDTGRPPEAGETLPAGLRLAIARSMGGDGGPWVEEAKLTASDGAAFDNFGSAVALSGDTALVGARGTDAAYVFVRDGEGWSEQARLTASQGGSLDDGFGVSVALSGDVALIGAWAATVGSNSAQGAAYVFVRDGETWSEQARLTAADGAVLDRFGISVALSGDTALVGSYFSDIDGADDQGAAYVFVRDGETWSEQAKLTAADGAAGDQLGVSVALSEETALLGAHFADVGGAEDRGAAYVFVREGETWSEQAKLEAADGMAGDQLGLAVSLDGETALVGAAGADVGGAADRGAAHVFTRAGEMWSESAQLLAPDGAASDQFGVATALSADTAMVGAYGVDNTRGAAYVFVRSDDVWGDPRRIEAADGFPGDQFGRKVAVAGQTAVAGAANHWVDGNNRQGAAYVFVEVPTSATLEGTVRSLGSCGEHPVPLAEITVEVAGQQGTYSEITDDEGFYRFVLDVSESPVDIAVTAPDHLPASVEDLVFEGGEIVVRDFDLVRDVPCATASPDGLAVTLDPNESTTEALTIGNVDGAATLDWSLATATPGTLGGGTSAGFVPNCEGEPVLPGLIIHDDGTAESGISDDPDFTTLQAFVDRFTPEAYPADLVTVCAAFFTLGPTSLDFEIVVFDDDGANGGPGTELGALEVTAEDIPVGETLELWFSYDVSALDINVDAGSVYIGVRWAPADPGVWMLLDRSTDRPPGIAGGHFWNNTDFDDWIPTHHLYWAQEYRSSLVRAVLDPSGCLDPGSSTADWLSVDTVSGSVPAGGTSEVEVTIDSADLIPGEYHASVCIESNDPRRPVLPVPVALTVPIGPPFAGIEGTVQGLGHCSADPGPVEETQVVIETQEQTYTVTADADGVYHLPVLADEGPVDITASAPGYFPQTVSNVELVLGETVTRNFDLVLDAPCVAVEPAELTVELPEGAGTELDLSLRNIDGGAVLDWTLETAEPLASNPARGASREPADRRRGATGLDRRAPAGPAVEAAMDLATQLGGALPGVRPVSPVGLRVDCTSETGLIVHDDGTVENGYTGNPEVVPEVIFVDRFTPSVHPANFDAVCVALLTMGPPSLDFEIVAFDDDGDNGGPGTELGALPVTASGIPGTTGEPVWFRYDISPLNLTIDSGSVFIGVRYATSDPNIFVASDQSASHPVGFAGGYWWNFIDSWTPIENAFPAYRSLFVRAVENPGGCFGPSALPWLSVDLEAGEIPPGGATPLEIVVDTAGLDAGEHRASLCVFTNDPVRPLVVVPVTLTVTATPAPELTFTPSPLDFGDIEVGTTSPPSMVILHNAGNADATGLSFAPLASGFDAETGECGTALPVGASCEIGVTFTPVEVGPAEASLQVDSAEGVSTTLGLTGRGFGVAAFTPTALTVDPVERVSNGNGVLEADELVDVMPSWRNDGLAGSSLTATASDFRGPEGATYSLADADADYGLVDPGATGSCDDVGVCYRLGVNAPPARPAAHWEAVFDETLDDLDGTTKTWTLHIGESFTDAPPSNLFYPFIETLLHHDVTGGCTATEYCPTATNTRSQMAVFLLKAVEDDPDYAPPACAEDGQMFPDVPFDSIFCPWIEELAARGITSGCAGGNYCPDDTVTRAQMAVFLLKAFEGDGYTPSPCTGTFADVPCPSPFADWIEELVTREITSGCAEAAYCPSLPVTRAQMAVFVTKAFGFTLYGP